MADQNTKKKKKITFLLNPGVSMFGKYDITVQIFILLPTNKFSEIQDSGP